MRVEAYTCQIRSHTVRITMTELEIKRLYLRGMISAGIRNLPCFATFSCSLVSLLFCSLIPNLT